MSIRLFKTTVRSKKQVLKLEPELNSILHGMNWNFDLSDCDKVLRIETDSVPLEKLTKMMNKNNYQLIELF
ncbi:MAG: hypothetical protein ACKVQV_14800 [Bacteroidia bacterium]